MKIQYTYECPDCHTTHRIDTDTDEMLKLPVKSLSDSELRRAIGVERSRIRSGHPEADAVRRIKRKIANAGKVNQPEDTAELEKAVKLLELEQAKRRVAAMMAEIGIEG